MKLLRIFVRLIWISCALFIASLVASAVVAIAVFNSVHPDFWFKTDPFQAGVNMAMTGLIVILFIASFSLVPAGIAIIVGEIFRLRSWLYYAAAGALTAATALTWHYQRQGGFAEGEGVPPIGFDSWQIMILLAAGLAGGLAYWAVAGRSAGKVLAPRLTREEGLHDTAH